MCNEESQLEVFVDRLNVARRGPASRLCTYKNLGVREVHIWWLGGPASYLLIQLAPIDPFETQGFWTVASMVPKWVRVGHR